MARDDLAENLSKVTKSEQSEGKKISDLAPLAIFAYRRLDSMNLVLDALEACAEFATTPVYVFSDGPKGEIDRADVHAVREAIRKRLRPNMTLIEQPSNLGLAPSVIAGVTRLCSDYGRAIIFEDDHVASIGALAWFNAALDRYADDEQVMSVGGCMYDVPKIRKTGRAVFMAHPTPTTWAVWDRSWKLFDPVCSDWRERLRDPAFRKRFRARGGMRYIDMMREQQAGRSSSWAIRWQYSVAKHTGLVLYPPEPMVTEIGADSFATHGQRTERLLPVAPLWKSPLPPPLPDTVALDQWAIDHWSRKLKYSLYGFAMLVSGSIYRLRNGKL